VKASVRSPVPGRSRSRAPKSARRDAASLLASFPVPSAGVARLLIPFRFPPPGVGSVAAWRGFARGGFQSPCFLFCFGYTIAMSSRWRFSLAAALLAIAIVGIAIQWWILSHRARLATAAADEAITRYDAGLLAGIDVIEAFQRSLEADLALPLHSNRTAYETHLRRLGQMRLKVENQYPATGNWRPIVEFTTHYELSRRKFTDIAGKRRAEAVDAEFDFPYRDQVDGHPAAFRSL